MACPQIANFSYWGEPFFHKQNYGSYESSSILHYAFYTPIDCIEVLSEFTPKVEWLN
ncbi:MAG: hypothetical protein HRT73_16425 [Flavobacteriales bacterium]|nr:hypothetical protein [Flavobacteriales bacterium]